jgi:hypothetical protein
MQTETLNGQINTGKGNVMPLGAELRTNYTNDFKYVVLSSWSFNSLLSSGDKKISIQGNYMEADAPKMIAPFLDLTSWVTGNEATGTTNPSRCSCNWPIMPI